VKELLKRLQNDWCIDPKQIYATGFSNGGFLSHKLACEMADVFAAIAPVSGVMGMLPEKCNPSRAVPVIDFHGTGDPIVPYNGGTPILPVDFGNILAFRSVETTMTIWRQKDGCLGQGKNIYSKGDATCTSWAPCNANVDVVHCKIDNGGHTWPGGVPIPFVGKTSSDISATESMIAFFKAHPLP
jgi:polyhydroxybutyrate depolymerase